MNLDKFLQESVKETFTINNKEYVADISAKTMLKITDLVDMKDESERIIKVMELLFGKEISDKLFNTLSISGINAIVEKVFEKTGIIGNEENLNQ